MRAEILNKRITIQQPPTTKDSYGQLSENWVNVATVWASIEPLNGKEIITAQKESSEVSIKVKIRYRSGIQAKMRIAYGSRIFEIVYLINPDERNKELTLMCKEIT